MNPYLPPDLDISSLQEVVLDFKQDETTFKDLAFVSSPLLTTYLRICLDRASDAFTAQEKHRLEKLVGKPIKWELDPEDLSQELLIDLLTIARKYKPTHSFAAYLSRVLRYKVAALLKKQRVLLVPLKKPHRWYPPLLVKGVDTRLLNYLVDGYTIRQIARLEGSSKSTIHRRIKELRQQCVYQEQTKRS